MNLCRACGADFASLALFDAHHVGRHDVDYPAHDDGRRCLTRDEMIERGWETNDRGRWHDPAAVAAVREKFGSG